MQRDELCAYLDEVLESGRFRDYCPNGLQAEGTRPIRRLVCGVTASLALLKAARAARADAAVVLPDSREWGAAQAGAPD